MTAESPLSLYDLLVIHELLLDHFGGMRGVTEHGFGKLEAAVAAPYVSMFGDDLYPDLQSKAAALFYSLARAHGFSDGNKRVALVALIDFLAQHAMRLDATEDELYVFVTETATDATREHVLEWITARMRPKD